MFHVISMVEVVDSKVEVVILPVLDHCNHSHYHQLEQANKSQMEG